MTKTSYREATKKEGKEDARMIIDVKEMGGIRVVQDPKDTGKFSEQFNLGTGEASVIVAAGEKDDVVLTDDGKGLKAARANNVERATAISALISLVENNIVKGVKASNALKILEREGRYDPYIIDDARERIEEV